MKKYIKYFLFAALVFAVIGYKIYNKPHKDIEAASSDVLIEAKALFLAFEHDEQKANEKYLDKIIEVSGTVKEVQNEGDDISVVLETEDMMFGVICQLDQLSKHKRTKFEVGETIKLKGICTGKLMDVVMVRCVEA